MKNRVNHEISSNMICNNKLPNNDNNSLLEKLPNLAASPFHYYKRNLDQLNE